jgi:hypothetical protein
VCLFSGQPEHLEVLCDPSLPAVSRKVGGSLQFLITTNGRPDRQGKCYHHFPQLFLGPLKKPLNKIQSMYFFNYFHQKPHLMSFKGQMTASPSLQTTKQQPLPRLYSAPPK